MVVTALPAAGWQFQNWNGSLSGARNPDTLLIDEDEAVMAVFAEGTGVRTPGPAAVYALAQNYPNPFNAVTMISFSLERAGKARLEVVNTLGRVVRVLADRSWMPGAHRVAWDGRDDAGMDAGAGVYFCRITHAQGVKWIKMSLVR